MKASTSCVGVSMYPPMRASPHVKTRLAILPMCSALRVHSPSCASMLTARSRLKIPTASSETRLTAADEAIRGLADEVRAACGGGALAQAHALLERLHREMVFDLEMTDVVPSASEAFALKRGVCCDLCHVFIAAAHRLGIPARYIAGYLQLADGRIDQ